ncbi:thermonuclease family protein [Aestuariimicrobium ganziense]|uniref:thermonuclease family protein n=1 Tax=Aestuariimicrobium ganziense TaxID=2773677 RepID=UPI001941ECD6|nr:thermonuclease family protein [Aestuariimicrobium ganziense]
MGQWAKGLLLLVVMAVVVTLVVRGWRAEDDPGAGATDRTVPAGTSSPSTARRSGPTQTPSAPATETARQVAATVEFVIDGDTIIADIAGTETTVRLLNIDSPETRPNEPADCLGPQATTALRQMLPKGSQVMLEYDLERRDRYGRTLAGVYLDGRLLNVEMARRGLAVAVLFRPNAKFHGQVVAAQRQAEAAKVGMFDPTVGCTLPARVAAAQVDLPRPKGTTLAAAQTDLARVTSSIGRARARGAELDEAARGRHPVWVAAFRDSAPQMRRQLLSWIAKAERSRAEHQRHVARLSAGASVSPSR